MFRDLLAFARLDTTTFQVLVKLAHRELPTTLHLRLASRPVVVTRSMPMGGAHALLDTR